MQRSYRVNGKDLRAPSIKVRMREEALKNFESKVKSLNVVMEEINESSKLLSIG